MANQQAFLMNNSQKLQELANNSKKFGQKFTIDKIIQNWLKLFENMKGSR